MAEDDDTIEWHHRLNGHEFEQALGDGAEKAMATHSGTPAWEIPWTEQPGRLQSVGSQKTRT